MKLTGILSLAFASTAFAMSLFRVNEADREVQDLFTLDDKIPGDSPMSLCPNQDHSLDLLNVTFINTSPNPPVAGEVMIVDAAGLVKQEIRNGSYIDLEVKYGLIRLIKQQFDLCEQLSEHVGIQCPVAPGELQATKEVELPKQIPPGRYAVTARVLTPDDVQITCMTATVVFRPGRRAVLEWN
ncbi:Phosphatidylglycerol/phosphatidylinositol transfer protein [Saitoella coloradoensis]